MNAYDVTLTYGQRSLVRRFHAANLDALYGVVHQLCPRARIIGPSAIRRVA
jgi:hypothetical protein